MPGGCLAQSKDKLDHSDVVGPATQAPGVHCIRSSHAIGHAICHAHVVQQNAMSNLASREGWSVERVMTCCAVILSKHHHSVY